MEDTKYIKINGFNYPLPDERIPQSPHATSPNY